MDGTHCDETDSDRHAHLQGVGAAGHLADHLAEILTPSSAIVCIGNELNGDDGAGCEVGRQLSGKVPWSVYETQTVPESFLMKIVAGKPESVVLVDALHFDAVPGTVEIIQGDQVGGQGPSTHGPAPLAFLEILQMLQPCRTAVVGIQPAQTEIGQGLSDPVRKGVQLVIRAFEMLAKSANGGDANT